MNSPWFPPSPPYSCRTSPIEPPVVSSLPSVSLGFTPVRSPQDPNSSTPSLKTPKPELVAFPFIKQEDEIQVCSVYGYGHRNRTTLPPITTGEGRCKLELGRVSSLMKGGSPTVTGGPRGTDSKKGWAQGPTSPFVECSDLILRRRRGFVAGVSRPSPSQWRSFPLVGCGGGTCKRFLH